MEKKEKASQPSQEAEKVLNGIVNNSKTEVEVRGKKWKVGAVYNDTLDWITNILQNEENPAKVNAKCFAALYLNSFFSLRFFFWIVWRWFYYVRQYTDEEMAPVIAEVKKKVTAKQTMYFVNTISLIDMRTTTQAMTKEEAEHIRRELSGASLGQQQSPHKGA